MQLIINALLALLFFLTLFGLSFWPLLFRAKTYRNIIYAGANVICGIMLIAYLSAPGKARRQNERTAADFRQNLARAAELLDSGKNLPAPLPEIHVKKARNADEAHEQIARWSDAVRAAHYELFGPESGRQKKSAAPAEPAAPAESAAPAELPKEKK